MLRAVFLALTLFSLTSCAGLDNTSYGSGTGYSPVYSQPYYSRDDYYNDRERDRLHHERHELEREQQRLDRERERFEREKQQQNNRPVAPPPVYSKPQPDRCPSGFRPGRCTDKQRKHGCKDMRTSGGLGCMSS